MNITLRKNLNLFGARLSFFTCAIALCLFVFSLPGFSFGVWAQSETPIIMLHGLSAIMLIGLLLTSYQRPYIQRIFFHRYFILPLLIALCALVFMPFHKLPVRSFVGSVRIGEGLVWWLDFATISATFLLMSRLYWPKRLLIGTALISFAVCYALSVTFYHTGFYFTPFYFPDYLAFMLISLIPICAALMPQFANHKVFWVMTYVAVIILMYFTNNNIGTMYSLIGALFILGLWFAPLGTQAFRSNMLRLTLAAIPILATIIVVALAYIPLETGFYHFANTPYAPIQTVLSRAYIIKTILTPMYENPLLFLTGFGWGSFVDILNQNLALEWIDFTRKAGAQWDGIITDHFHSHNSFIEALYASGLLAMALWYLFLLSFALFTTSSMMLTGFVFAGGILSLFSFWFIMPLVIPFIAFGAALISKKNDRKFFAVFKFARPALFLILFSVVIAQACGAYIAAHTVYNTTAYAPPKAWPKDGNVECELQLTDFGAGGLHMSKILISRTRFIGELHEEINKHNEGEDIYPGFDPEKNKNKIKKEIPALTNLICQSVLYNQHYEASNRLLIARLAARGEMLIAMSEYMSEDEQSYYLNGWAIDLKNWLKENPQRPDQAIVFLSWHLLNGRENMVHDVATIIHNQDQENPIGLWFYGITLLSNPSAQAQGISFLKQALQNGIERFMPIEDDIKVQLLGPQGSNLGPDN